MKPHRHLGQVTGATYNPVTGTSLVFRRCRCGERDSLEVMGKWYVGKRAGEVWGVWERDTRGGRVRGVRQRAVRAV